MNYKKLLGEKGEQMARNYLLAEGYEIIATNWRTGHKEIDIIARQEDIFIFIEVKTRHSSKFGMPETTLTETQSNAIVAAASVFLENKSYRDIRFDIIAIMFKAGVMTDFLHIKDAFY